MTSKGSFLAICVRCSVYCLTLDRIYQITGPYTTDGGFYSVIDDEGYQCYPSVDHFITLNEHRRRLIDIILHENDH